MKPLLAIVDVDITNDITSVKLTATKNGSETTQVKPGLEISFFVEVDKSEKEVKSRYIPRSSRWE